MRITQVSVTSLFGIFNHTIPLKIEDRVTIIHGPNGFGKTALLTMLDGLFNARYSELRKIPFEEFRVQFDNGRSMLWITRSPAPARDTRSRGANGHRLALHFRDSGKEMEPFPIDQTETPKDLRFPLNYLEHEIPELIRTGPSTWRYIPTDEELTAEDILDRFPDALPPSMRQLKPAPPWLKELSVALPVRFIKTQRLLSLYPFRRPREYRESLSMVPTVNTYSEELAKAIQSKLAESAALSQTLDRTFPARVLKPDEPSHLTSEQLRELLSQLEQKRSHLMEAGLLDTARDMDFQVPQQIDERAKSILSVHVKDVEQKLGVFDEMVAKIDLLKKIINERFLYKKVDTSKDKGFTFVTSDGELLVPADLSSGEQHELVLLYELLFKVKPGSCILIDEPELSLHVAWQEAFLPDLLNIAKLVGFDVIVATHSPQIINDRWDLTVELKGPDR